MKEPEYTLTCTGCGKVWGSWDGSFIARLSKEHECQGETFESKIDELKKEQGVIYDLVNLIEVLNFRLSNIENKNENNK